ncbi:MAG: helix-turn-helix domain-containing protein [Alphaproteobacteria bacterium]
MPNPVHQIDAPLPQVLAEIADLTDLGCALSICQAHGGTRLFCPLDPKPHHKLAQLVGLDHAQAIAKSFGGLYIDVPLFSAHKTRELNRSINVLATRGLTRADIARELGVTERTVYRHLADTADQRQTDLEDWLNAASN